MYWLLKSQQDTNVPVTKYVINDDNKAPIWNPDVVRGQVTDWIDELIDLNKTEAIIYTNTKVNPLIIFTVINMTRQYNIYVTFLCYTGIGYFKVTT